MQMQKAAGVSISICCTHCRRKCLMSRSTKLKNIREQSSYNVPHVRRGTGVSWNLYGCVRLIKMSVKNIIQDKCEVWFVLTQDFKLLCGTVVSSKRNMSLSKKHISCTKKLTSRFHADMYRWFPAMPKKLFHTITHKPKRSHYRSSFGFAKRLWLLSAWQNPLGHRRRKRKSNSVLIKQQHLKLHRVYSMWQPELTWHGATHINWYFRCFLFIQNPRSPALC